MVGPCMCGDPACSSCGDPYAAELEAAEEWATEALSNEKLTPGEYRLAVEVGLAAVRQHRELAASEIEQAKQVWHEAMEAGPHPHWHTMSDAEKDEAIRKAI